MWDFEAISVKSFGLNLANVTNLSKRYGKKLLTWCREPYGLIIMLDLRDIENV